jgi:hypothetical protein
LIVAGVEVRKLGVAVILLSDEPALFGEGAGGNALRAVGVVVERLRHFPILVRRHIRSAEVVRVQVRRGGIRGSRATTVAKSVPSGEKICLVVVAVSELEATL